MEQSSQKNKHLQGAKIMIVIKQKKKDFIFFVSLLKMLISFLVLLFRVNCVRMRTKTSKAIQKKSYGLRGLHYWLDTLDLDTNSEYKC